MRGEYRLHGPPGTGKTTALTQRWLPAALQRVRPWGQPVLVCSLTQTAATEIAGRMGDDPLVQARTLHSHALRQLEGVKVLTPAALKSWNDRYPDWRMTGGASVVDGVARSEAKGDTVLAELDLHRHRMERVPPHLEAFADAWSAWLLERELVDFTGMIERALEVARDRRSQGSPPHRGDPGVLIVDEAQDCSRLEQSLVGAWGETASFFVLAGDADQAIYTWRGASPQDFLGKHLPPEAHYQLEQSYRVPQAPHELAQGWIRRIEDRRDVPYRPIPDVRGSVVHSPASMRSAAAVVAQIGKELEVTGPSGSVMLLFQSAYMAKDVLKVLRQRSLPFANRYRPEEAQWNPLAVLERARRFLRGFPPWADDLGVSPRLWTLQELHRWLATVSSDAVPKGVKARVRSVWEAEKDDRGRVLGLEDLHDLWGGRAEWVRTEAAITDDPLRWLTCATLPRELGSLPTAVRMLGHLVGESVPHASAALPGGVLTNALIRHPEPRLTVGTIHSVKGGEADSVILCPDVSQAAQREGDRDALVRLFYVGITRTRGRLVILAPGAQGSASL